MRPLRLLFLLILTSAAAIGQNVLVTGTVRDASTNDPIAGATVRLIDGSRGTYSARGGTFRLPLPSGTYRLVVSSIGYASDTVEVRTGAAAITVTLAPAAVELGGVAVTAELTADDVVRSAIVRKAENLARLKTFKGLLYSKFSLDLAGNAFGAIGDEDRATIMETFSRYFYDRERDPPIHIEVVNRRQTANIPSQGNLFALGNFVSFYDDDLPLLNARVMTPLSDEAFSRYRFEFGGRTTLAGETVFVIEVIPTTTVLPAFEGTMKIVKGSYNLVEVDLKPTEATAIAFVRDLRFVQRFEHLARDIWYPTYLEITGQANVEIIKGLAEIDATVRATSIVSEATVNEPIPDSIFAPRIGVSTSEGEQQIITAAPDADSARSEFWENNALSELSEEEKATYARTDSLVASLDTNARQDERAFGFTFLPMVDFNRVAGVTPIANTSLDIGSIVDVGVSGAYGFGMKRFVGEANVTMNAIDEPDLSLAFTGSLFTRLGTNFWDRSIPRIFNTVIAGLLHRDYYDWYRQDGWSAGVRAELFGVTATAALEDSRHFGVGTTQARSLFVRDLFRSNPLVVDGSYRTYSASLGYGIADGAVAISSGASADFGAKITAVTGERAGSDEAFSGIEGKLLFELPTLGTGYVPMLLRIAAHAGIGSEALPLEYQFRMRTSSSIVAPFGHFMTPKIGELGGTQYVALHAEHNFSDIVWRWIGLPTYWGRGVEFIVSGAAGRYTSTIPTRQQLPTHPLPGYRPTGDRWYTEVGFGLGKIPTFISNVMFLRLDARFGVGVLGRGNWGVGLSLSSPF